MGFAGADQARAQDPERADRALDLGGTHANIMLLMLDGCRIKVSLDSVWPRVRTRNSGPNRLAPDPTMARQKLGRFVAFL